MQSNWQSQALIAQQQPYSLTIYTYIAKCTRVNCSGRNGNFKNYPERCTTIVNDVTTTGQPNWPQSSWYSGREAWPHQLAFLVVSYVQSISLRSCIENNSWSTWKLGQILSEHAEASSEEPRAASKARGLLNHNKTQNSVDICSGDLAPKFEQGGSI